MQQSAGTLDLYSLQIRASAFEGESVSVTDLLTHGLGHAGCDQLLCNDVNCTDVFTTGVDASGAVSCAALTATGAVAGAALTSTGAVSGSSLSITGAASVGLLSSATGITGSTLTINNTANAGNFTTAGDVSTGTLTASGGNLSKRGTVELRHCIQGAWAKFHKPKHVLRNQHISLKLKLWCLGRALWAGDLA